MKKLALLTLMACASAPFAQLWMQPWTPPMPSFESRVFACANPAIVNLIAADDFTIPAAPAPTPVFAINWWGTVSAQPQLNRPYYIAIYADMGCRPNLNAILYRACVVPQTQPVGVDCQGKQVYKFFSNVPAGALALGGGRYWLQVSEIDQQSIQPGIVNFWWSAHDPVVQCSALQINAAGGMFPLLDPCFQRKVDLAFEIF